MRLKASLGPIYPPSFAAKSVACTPLPTQYTRSTHTVPTLLPTQYTRKCRPTLASLYVPMCRPTHAHASTDQLIHISGSVRIHTRQPTRTHLYMLPWAYAYAYTSLHAPSFAYVSALFIRWPATSTPLLCISARVRGQFACRPESRSPALPTQTLERDLHTRTIFNGTHTRARRGPNLRARPTFSRQRAHVHGPDNLYSWSPFFFSRFAWA